MKAQYRQIFHTKAPDGTWKPGKFQPKTYIHVEDAAARNRHFNEHGMLLVPEKDYSNFLKNKICIN